MPTPREEYLPLIDCRPATLAEASAVLARLVDTLPFLDSMIAMADLMGPHGRLFLYRLLVDRLNAWAQEVAVPVTPPLCAMGGTNEVQAGASGC